MMEQLDSFSDWWRLFMSGVALVTLYLVVQSFRKKRDSWNPKTKDNQLALLLWSFATAEGMLEAIVTDVPSGPRLVFFSFAMFVTTFAVVRRGDWGENGD